MSMSLRFRLQQRKVQVLEETYESWKADHAAAMAARDLEEMVAECRSLSGDLVQSWKRTWDELTQGGIQDLDAYGHALGAHYDRAIRLLDSVAENARTFAIRTGHTIEGLAELSEAAARVTRLRERILANWPWSTRPWPPLNRAMQQQARSGQDGPGEPVEAILQRLQQGGPLVEV
jgi:hypothetical protein